MKKIPRATKRQAKFGWYTRVDLLNELEQRTGVYAIVIDSILKVLEEMRYVEYDDVIDELAEKKPSELVGKFVEKIDDDRKIYRIVDAKFCWVYLEDVGKKSKFRVQYKVLARDYKTSHVKQITATNPFSTLASKV